MYLFLVCVFVTIFGDFFLCDKITVIWGSNRILPNTI